jgi:hypothetical protein
MYRKPISSSEKRELQQDARRKRAVTKGSSKPENCAAGEEMKGHQFNLFYTISGLPSTQHILSSALWYFDSGGRILGAAYCVARSISHFRAHYGNQHPSV